MKIVISDSCSYKCIVIATFLKKNYPSIEIVTFSDSGLSKILHTRYADRHIIIRNSCKTHPQDYIKEVNTLLEKEAPEFFFPVNSEEMHLLLGHKDLLGKPLSYWGDYGTFRTLNEKNKLYELAAELKVKTPVHYSQINHAQVPFVVKPIRLSSAKGVRYIFTEEEKKALLSGNLTPTDFVIQEYIGGDGVGFSVFAINGEMKVSYGHRRLFEYPVSGGSSVYRENFSHPDMQAATEKILNKTRWSGFAMFEFKLTPANEIVLIEVNPRIWGSINQGLQNGVNYFEPLLGPPARKQAPAKEIKTYLPPLFYVSLLGYLLKGNFKKLLLYLNNFKRSKPDVSLLKDFRGRMSIWLKVLDR